MKLATVNARATAAAVLVQVINQHRHLNDVLDQQLADYAQPRDSGLIRELCYGVCRWYFRLDAYLKPLLRKPLKGKDQDIHCLLLIGLYQLLFMRVPSHAAINETVQAAKALKKVWAVKLMNAVLRQVQRQLADTAKQNSFNEEVEYSHPQWFIDKIKQAWPQRWQAILNANNQQAPMCVRINTRMLPRDDYLALLTKQDINAAASSISPSGIDLMKPMEVRELPGFAKGWFSIQDTAAQLAAPLLQMASGQRVLDACAAPGGKTTHMMECQPDLLSLIAIDNQASRLSKLKENCERLQVPANIICADANDLDSWWDGQLFDRILLDAPCSATGVIRRHPDIKLLRQADDLKTLNQQQLSLLHSLWKTLKPQGLLLYATCSLLPEENEQLVASFISQQQDVTVIPISATWGTAGDIGRQILPDQDPMDGFYYALLQKV